MSTPFDAESYGKKPFDGSRMPFRVRAVLLGLNLTLIGAVLLTSLPFYVLILYVAGVMAYDEVPRIQYHGIAEYLGYFNIQRPSWKDGITIVVTIVVLYATLFLIGSVATSAGAPEPTNHAIQGDSLSNPLVVGLYVAAFFLFVAPFEEFLFRHKLQKDWLGKFNVVVRLLSASAFFAVLHYPVYGLSPGGTFSVAVIFVNALFFGAAYELTDNLTVPVIVHATFNSVSVLAIFLLSAGIV